jgi:protocatechuate 3,4-dioxygenase alpha subunit
MNGDSARIPASSQTVGPYFRIGLQRLIECTPALAPETRGTIELRGRVHDSEGAPVADAMLEFWNAAAADDRLDGHENRSAFPAGFRRVITDEDGRFSVVIESPKSVPQGDQHAHAPHMLVLVFARGLLRHLISRVYLGDEQANADDPVLMKIPEERRTTLIARPDQSRAGLYRWDVILQGAGETVFFAW